MDNLRRGSPAGAHAAVASASRVGRPGGNRTPNPRFWRPVLCQLSYWPLQRITSWLGIRGSGVAGRRFDSPAATNPEPRTPNPEPGSSFRLSMRRVLPAEAAELRELQPLGRLLLVLGRTVVPPLALLTSERDDVSHNKNPAGFGIRDSGSGIRDSGFGTRNESFECHERITIRHESRIPNPTSRRYSRISVIVPDPTVRPPSRTANRPPFSSATGVISSAVIVVLSPGITISTPSGRCSVPVTSVVRM
jgi:hypothetical protein